MNRKEFNDLMKMSYKSLETEEWIDIYFTRPIGLVMALICRALHIHPNAITIVSIFLGIGAGFMFYNSDLQSNLIGVALMMAANFCDSADGQLARINNQKTLMGRMLDGFASDVWYFCCYFAIACRLAYETIPGTDTNWGIWIWILCALGGFGGHARQARIADYYRQIHLFFLLGKEGSELNSFKSQRAIAEKHLRDHNWIGVLYFWNYSNYCHAQEKATPNFQRLKNLLTEKYGNIGNVPEHIRQEIHDRSLPLMKYTNILTHNWRAITLFTGCLLNEPWIYPLAEITVFLCIYIYMYRTHEGFCQEIYEKER